MLNLVPAACIPVSANLTQADTVKEVYSNLDHLRNTHIVKARKLDSVGLRWIPLDSVGLRCRWGKVWSPSFGRPICCKTVRCCEKVPSDAK